MSTNVILSGDLSRVFTYTDKRIPGVNGTPTPGVIFRDDEGRAFKFVLNGHSAAQTAGNWGSVDLNGAGLTVGKGPLSAIAGNLSVVFKPSTATLMMPAGVWMGAAPLSSSSQTGAGWVQFKGVCDPAGPMAFNGLNSSFLAPGVLVDSTTDIAIGDLLKVVDASFAAVKDVAGGTVLPTFTNFAVALAARTSNDTGLIKALLCCDRIV